MTPFCPASFLGLQLVSATCLGEALIGAKTEALAETECLFIPLQAMFHFRLLLGKKMRLKHLILCNLPVQNIFTCRRGVIYSKPPTCHEAGSLPL